MPISPAAGFFAAATAAHQASSTPGSSAVSDANTVNKDTFMKLLVAQLQNQNPMDPADPTQFIAQTAQFTMVQELDDMATQLKSSAVAQKLSTASSLIGHEVTFLNTDGSEGTGVVKSARLATDTTYLKIGDKDVPIEFITGVEPHSHGLMTVTTQTVTPPTVTAPTSGQPPKGFSR